MYRQETIQLHKIACTPGFRMVLTPHAEKRMEKRDVSRVEVERILKAGLVVMIETDPDGTERWRVAGRDADGHRLELVIEPEPPDLMVVVTVIRID